MPRWLSAPHRAIGRLIVDKRHQSAQLERFLSGWRYIETAADAEVLPSETVAIEDDSFVWDLFDPVVACSQRDRVFEDDEGNFHMAWIESDDHVEQACPRLPFFAWHPTFCRTADGQGTA